MLIDFHTHAFPDTIAEGAMTHLIEKSGGLKTYTNGTVSDLVEKMEDWHIDNCVLLNIATSPKQQKNVNDFAISTAQNNKTVISFGSVHPDSHEADAMAELDRISTAGLKGVKFHPEYQNFQIDDKRVYALYQKCSDLGLIMVFHAGRDLGFPNSLNAPPKGIRNVVNDFPNAKMVMAHMGGLLLVDEVLEYVAGSNCYIDTSFSDGYISKADAEKIIKKHGVNKVLFASDCPWASPKQTLDFIETLDFSAREKQMIYYKNAVELLGL